MVTISILKSSGSSHQYSTVDTCEHLGNLQRQGIFYMQCFCEGLFFSNDACH